MGRPRKYATEEERKAAYRASQAKWVQNNLDYISEWQRTHKEVHRASQAKWAQNNKEHIAEYRQTLFGMCSHKSSAYRAYDKKRFGTDEGSVTAEQMKEMIELHPHCFYCGCEDINQLGLDRIDNSKPHTVDNCVVACLDCNKERKAMSFKDFVSLKKIDSIFTCTDEE